MVIEMSLLSLIYTPQRQKFRNMVRIIPATWSSRHPEN